MTTSDKINNLIGMENFKAIANKIVKITEYSFEIAAAENLGNGIYIFIGNPNTGKKTAAKMFGELLQEIGLIKNGNVIIATKKDFIGEYIGESNKKTKDFLKKVIDGILYIDGAYSLIQDERDAFGREAMDTIYNFCYENYNRSCLIFSDCSENIENLLKNYIPLKTKVREFITFEDHPEC